jgi:hypothetical protein
MRSRVNLFSGVKTGSSRLLNFFTHTGSGGSASAVERLTRDCRDNRGVYERVRPYVLSTTYFLHYPSALSVPYD